MSAYGSPCPECVPCAAEDCTETAHCLSEPGRRWPHCERHAHDLAVARDPFLRPSRDDGDPWADLAAESRAVTDRFWSSVGDRPRITETTKGEAAG